MRASPRRCLGPGLMSRFQAYRSPHFTRSPRTSPRGSPPPLPSRQDSGRTGRDARHPPAYWPMARKYTATGPEASCEYAPGSAASVSLYGGAPDPLCVRTGGREGTRWAAAAPARCAGDTQRSGQGGTCGQPPWTGTRKASPGKRRKIPGTPGSFREQARRNGPDRPPAAGRRGGGLLLPPGRPVLSPRRPEMPPGERGQPLDDPGPGQSRRGPQPP
jgi:hypothetical protein